MRRQRSPSSTLDLRADLPSPVESAGGTESSMTRANSPPRIAMRLSSMLAPASPTSADSSFTSPGRSVPTAVSTT